MNLTIPHHIIDEQAAVTDLDAALTPIMQHLDPDKEQDLGGEAGVYFSSPSFEAWDQMSDEERGYYLLRFAEFICRAYGS